MIELDVNRAYLGGRADGRYAWNLIKDEIDYNKQNTIALPDGLTYITESYFDGFVEELVSSGYDVKSVIRFKCGNAYIKSLLYIYMEKLCKKD